MTTTADGIFTLTPTGTGILRSPERSFVPTPHDIIVPRNLVRQFHLVQGARVEGTAIQGKKGFVLESVSSICSGDAQKYIERIPFRQLTAVKPAHRFRLGTSGDISMRLIDLMAPIGRGTRGLVVSPPKAGKTMLLELFAKAIYAENPEACIIILLVDERPEEVTFFKRAVNALVLASSSDQSIAQHVNLTEMTLAYIRTELECGKDVIVLVDSLTRMSRAFNLSDRGSGRTMTGGLDAGALEIPRRFFGLARDIENGGSVTILATILVDTGSRMDQLIFEEFKGTGNSEIVLDRALAEERIFPAIDIKNSGTRSEENLYDSKEANGIAILRRILAPLNSREALLSLKKLVSQYPSNVDLLGSLMEKSVHL